jgi:transcription-repair coupling factor (superfamily II helicase)
LKENEFKDLYPEESNIETKEYVKDLQIDTDFELLFSDEYINNVSERLSLYNELGTVKKRRGIVFQNKLIDRFGPMPPRAKALMNSIHQVDCNPNWNRKISDETRQDDWVFHFDQQSDYYQSKRFHQVLQFVQKNSSILNERKQTSAVLRLLLTFDNVKHQNSARIYGAIEENKTMQFPAFVLT